MSRRGLLLTITEPPAYMEEEFNAWYDTEHLSAGTLQIRNFLASAGEPRHVAICELADANAVPPGALLPRSFHIYRAYA